MHIFLILIHVTMIYLPIMHLSMYDAFINFPQSLTVMHVCMMHISMVLDLDPEACMYVWFLMFVVCMCDAYFLDPDTCDHDASTYYAFIHDPWSWYMHVWCIFQFSSIPPGSPLCEDKTSCQSNQPLQNCWNLWPLCKSGLHGKDIKRCDQTLHMIYLVSE